eukprot:jgi/Psemu1/195114/e_gw1.167.124.1
MSPPIFVIVFAHPDDESMFFLPTIRSLVDAGETVWFLCLTTGNYDGLGKIREKELEKVGKLLGVSRVIVIVATSIRDSLWSNFQQPCRSNEPTNRFVLITFDELGVSGHVNHIDTYLGKNQPHQEHILLEVWHLQSERNILRKYAPLLSWIFVVSSNNSSIRIFRMHNPILNWKAMATHHSQFVWYRRLFVVFSCYTYCNKLVCRKSKATSQQPNICI